VAVNHNKFFIFSISLILSLTDPPLNKRFSYFIINGSATKQKIIPFRHQQRKHMGKPMEHYNKEHHIHHRKHNETKI
jgi:hypothetical protein